MSECRVLQKMNQRIEPDCLIAPNSVGQTELLEDVEGKGRSSPMGVAESPLYPRLLFVSKGIKRHYKSMF